MSWCLAVDLPELLDVFQRKRELAQTLVLGIDRAHAAQVQHGIEEHGRMTVRQNEAVAIGPDWIFGIVAQELLPENIHHGRQRHGCAGMT